MDAVQMAMSTIDRRRACLRPQRSPIQPNNSPPMGRIRKAPPNSAYALMIEADGEFDGKKAAPISGVRKPNNEKSYLRKRRAKRRGDS